MNMIKRTQQLSAAAACIAMMAGSGASQMGEPDSYNFKVYLDDKPIGYHQFELSESERGRQVTSEAKFDVKVLFINAFKYRHQSQERWTNNCLTAIDSTTNSNGKQQRVNAETVDTMLEIDSTAGEYAVDGCVQTFAYWNPSILGASKLLNSQTGDYVDVTVAKVGEGPVSVAGESVDAVQYNIKSTPDYSGKPVDITLWYNAAGTEWLALESLAKGKRKLRYERTDALSHKTEDRVVDSSSGGQ